MHSCRGNGLVTVNIICEEDISVDDKHVESCCSFSCEDPLLILLWHCTINCVLYTICFYLLQNLTAF